MMRLNHFLRYSPRKVWSDASWPHLQSKLGTMHTWSLRTSSSLSEPQNITHSSVPPITASESKNPSELSQKETSHGRSRHEVDNADFHNYTILDLMRARVHMGHRKKLWNPRMAPYLLGHRNGMHIINLDRTVPLLRRALIATSLMAENDCTFLWLGPRDIQKSKILEKEARKAGAHTLGGSRWIGGTLTNPINSNQAKHFNYRVPDCLFIVDVNRHMVAIREAHNVGIPTIGIADSDCDPQMLTYPIPGNDDNALAIYLYCSLMKYAILDGRTRGRRLNRPSFQIPNFQEARKPRQPSYRQ